MKKSEQNKIEGYTKVIEQVAKLDRIVDQVKNINPVEAEKLQTIKNDLQQHFQSKIKKIKYKSRKRNINNIE
jgi:tRNA isopentenyl-2-thiomethyl-A-37 hydroxylase MiaE